MRRTTVAGLGLAIAVGAVGWSALDSPAGAHPAGTQRAAAQQAGAQQVADPRLAAQRGVTSGTPGLTTEVTRAQVDAGADAQQRALTAYWTPARMRQAISADQQPAVRTAAAKLRVRQARQVAAARATVRTGARAGARTGAASRPQAQPQPTGPAGHVDGVAPRLAEPRTAATRTAATRTAATRAAATRPALRPTARLASYSPSYPAGHPVARTYGKVFFTNTTNHLNYVCSATVVSSEGRDAVWTAGHCVHGGAGGGWHANWVFAPNYDHGYNAYYGLWYANQLWTRNAWASSSDLTEDMGVAIVGTRYGYHIVDYTGGQGIAWNYSKDYYAYDFGYPQGPPFDGTRLIGCTGTTFPEWTFLWWSADTIGLHCDMTGGSSGGGWLRWFNGSWGYINGLNSYKYDNDPNTMYSPYFDGAASSLYNTIRYL